MIYLIIAAIIAGLDQLLKLYATNNLRGVGEVRLLPNLLHLTFRLNDGATLGMLSGARWALVTLSAVAALAIVAALFAKRVALPKAEKYALAAVLGGAVGNLIDRAFTQTGEVVDMLFFPWIGKIPLLPDFVCNIADIGVVFGAAVFLFLYARREFGKKDVKND